MQVKLKKIIKDSLRKKRLTVIFITVILVMFSWFSYGISAQHKLIHDYPIAYAATDSYWYYSHSKYAYDMGGYNKLPPYISTTEQSVTNHPPLFNQLVALVAHFTNIPIYDVQMILGNLFLLLAILILFLFIRRYDEKVAYSSVPLIALLFLLPFAASLPFGRFMAILGQLFLLATIFILSDLNFKYSSIVLSSFIAAMILGYTSEFFYFLAFLFIYCIFLLVLKKLKMSYIKKLFVAIIIALSFSAYYLNIFYWVYLKNYINQSKSAVVQKEALPFYYYISLYSLGPFRYITIGGLILSVFLIFKYSKKEANKLIFLLFPIFMFLITFTKYMGHGRIFQTTLFLPLFLSLPFGLFLYYIIKLVPYKKIKRSVFTYMSVSIILIITIFTVYNNPYFPPAIIKEQWDALTWLQKHTGEDANILMFYFETFEQGNTALWSLGRHIYLVNSQSLDSAIKKGGRQENFLIYQIRDNFEYYKTSNNKLFFSLKRARGTGQKEKSICDFNYIYFEKKPMEFVKERVDALVIHKIEKVITKKVVYSLFIGEELLKKDWINKVFENDVGMIIKNDKLGSDCLDDE